MRRGVLCETKVDMRRSVFLHPAGTFIANGNKEYSVGVRNYINTDDTETDERTEMSIS